MRRVDYAEQSLAEDSASTTGQSAKTVDARLGPSKAWISGH
jgi:hypothetical protein